MRVRGRGMKVYEVDRATFNRIRQRMKYESKIFWLIDKENKKYYFKCYKGTAKRLSLG
jgi:copper oxidase (laccase) domain-containing protein